VPLQAPWHARIIGAQGPVGGGVLVDSRRIVTCAHVIAEALRLDDLAQAPPGLVTIDFPQCPESELRTAVIRPEGWFPGNPGSGTGDLAMLEVLGDEVRSTRPAPLRYASRAAGRTFGVLGHPAGHDLGTWARATLTGVGGPGREWVQVDAVAPTGTRIQPGFSGAGLVDEEDGTVIGVVVVADRAPQNKVAWMIPVEVITGYWPHLRAVLGPVPSAQLGAAGRTPLLLPDEIGRLALMMLALRGISDRSSRGLFVAAIENQFPGRLVVQRQRADLEDTTALIKACLEHPGALHELVERLRIYHTLDADEQRRVGEIADMAEVADPAPLLDVTSRNKLYRVLGAWTGVMTSEIVRAAYRDAAGPLSSEPIVAYDLPSVIRVLESATTGPEGLPPLLGFLEGLARRLSAAPAAELHAWVDEFVLRDNTPRHLIARLRLSRPPAGQNLTTSYLLAELQNFGADDERYLSRVTLLQGDRRDRLPNARVLHGATTPLGIAEIPALFDSVLDHMWELPDVATDEVVIEFLLPLELLSEAVDQWLVQAGELAHPLCAEHHVIVRLRGRAELAKRGYGQWRTKTRRLREGNATVRWVNPNNAAAAPGKLFPQLFLEGAPCLVLEEPPLLGHSIGGDAVSSGIRAGVPVIIWCRDAASAQSFAAQLRRRLRQQDALELPTLVRQMRSDFFRSSFPAGEHITLVWDLEDEPTSLITRYQAPA
jgi:vWA-MoxR associated protein C-terminal domain/Trypsin-like peptidase domain/vWA-MoxR associated protein middle region 0/Effector-associated domain 2